MTPRIASSLLLVLVALVPAALAEGGAAPVNSAWPVLSGIARDGQTLTTSNGTWAGTAPITFGYAWRRCDVNGNNCATIATASGQSYVLTAADVGFRVSSLVTAANAAGSASQRSAMSATVIAAAPVNSAWPVLSGIARDGQTLTTSNGTWAGTAPITFGYAWRRCDVNGNNCATIATASGQSYVLTAADVGFRVSSLVTAANAAGSASQRSAMSATVIAAAPVNSAWPVLSGIARDGQTLTTSNGTWAGTAPITFGYAWRRCDVNGNNCATIATASGQSYVLTAADVGFRVSSLVTAANAAGSASQRSAVSAVVVASPSPPPPPPPATCVGVSIGTTTDLQQAVNANPSGTTFCISPGVHRMSSYVIAKSGDSFVGSPGAVLNGSKDITALFTSSGSYWVASGQAQQGTLAGQCLTGTACQYPDDVFFDDRPLQRVLSLSGLGPGKFYFDYAADRIYIGDSPAGHRVEAAVATRAFMGWGTGADNVTISGLVIEKFANEAQRGAINGRPSWVVKDSEVRLNHGIGIQDTGTVVNNHVHDNGQLGMMGYALASGALIEGNEIDHNNYAGFDYNWEGGGVKIAKTDTIAIRGNNVHDNDGIGLWCDTDCINVTYDNNRVINNKGIGILHEMSFAATIRNNVVEGNGFGYQGTGSLQGAGILLANSANVELYGNSIANNKDGMGMTQIDRGSGAYGYYNTHDNYFHNNTVTMSRGTSGLVEWEDTDNGIYYTGKNNRFQSNTYILHCLTTPFQWQNPTNPNTYASLTPTQWRAAGNDTTGTFTSSCP